MKSNHQFTPIALFAFNRQVHLKVTVESLQKNQESIDSNLFIFCDGPRNNEELQAVNAVRDYVKTITGFKEITIYESPVNKGLAQSIIDGVTMLCNKYGSAIIIEDDLELSPYFLKFMNDGLTKYACNERIASIHGYTPPVKAALPSTYFLRGADCWGWATWKRAWDKFEPGGSMLLKLLTEKNLLNKFDFDGSVRNIQMLQDQINGKNNSWAIRWHASMFLENMLTLYPGKSLVNNIGQDATGQHSIKTDIFDSVVSKNAISIGNVDVTETLKAIDAYKRHFSSLKVGFAKRIYSKIVRIMKIENDC